MHPVDGHAIDLSHHRGRCTEAFAFEPLLCMNISMPGPLGPQVGHAMASAYSHLSLQLCSGELLLLGSQCLLCGVRWAATDMRGCAVPCFNKLAWSLPPALPVLSRSPSGVHDAANQHTKAAGCCLPSALPSITVRVRPLCKKGRVKPLC